ncbi:hypothetical protein AB0K18_43150 [Nonomuraea sp. NPDC049421]|uniref:hypothetical protein n=1 Tax=Nonomuraea sp. NPDC049421 TaxID=3155275 RepID=UPI00341463D0
MTPTVAMSQLRAALAMRGVSTRDDDVRELRGGYNSILNLQGLVITCGPEWIRWFLAADRLWGWHRATDPVGAAHRLARTLSERASGSVAPRLCVGVSRVPVASPTRTRGRR